MNKGLKIASGQWVNFMNAGDMFIKSNILQEIFTDERIYNYDVIFGDKVLQLSDKQLYGIKAQPFCITKSIGMGINHQCIFTKTSLAQQHPFDLSYKATADYEMMHYLYTNHAIFYYCNKAIAFVEKEGFSSRNKKLQMKEEEEQVSGSPSRSIFIYWKGKLIQKAKEIIINLCPIDLRRKIYSRNKNIYLIKQ